MIRLTWDTDDQGRVAASRSDIDAVRHRRLCALMTNLAVAFIFLVWASVGFFVMLMPTAAWVCGGFALLCIGVLWVLHEIDEEIEENARFVRQWSGER